MINKSLLYSTNKYHRFYCTLSSTGKYKSNKIQQTISFQQQQSQSPQSPQSPKQQQIDIFNFNNNNNINENLENTSSASNSNSILKVISNKLYREKFSKQVKSIEDTIEFSEFNKQKKQNLQKYEKKMKKGSFPGKMDLDDVENLVRNNQKQELVPIYNLKYLFGKYPIKALSILKIYIQENHYSTSDIDQMYDWIKNTKYFLEPEVSNTFLSYYAFNSKSNEKVQTIIERFEDNEIQFTTETFNVILSYFIEKQENNMIHYWIKKLLSPQYRILVEESSQGSDNSQIICNMMKGYLVVEDFHKAIEYFEMLREASQKTRNLFKDFKLVLDTLCNVKRYELCVEFFKSYIMLYPTFLNSVHFTEWVNEIWEHNINIKLHVIDYLNEIELMSVNHYKYLIGNFLETDQTDKALTIYEYYLKKHLPCFAIYNTFIRYYVDKGNVDECMSVLEQMKKFGLISDVVIDFCVMELCQRVGDTENLNKAIDHLFHSEKSCKKISFIIVYCQINGYTTIFEAIQRRLMNPQFPKTILSTVSNQIIRDYLLMSKYEMALKWFGDRIVLYKLKPNQYTLDFFQIYHMNHPEKNEKENLINFWLRKREQFSLPPPNLDSLQESFLQFDVISVMENIDKFTPTGQLKLRLGRQGSSPTPEQLQLYRMSQIDKNIAINDNSPTDYALNSFYQLSDINSLFTELLQYMKNDVIPKGDILVRAVLAIAENDTKKYLELLQVASPTMRSIMFNDKIFSICIKRDIDSGVQLLNSIEKELWVSSAWTWNAIIVGLLNKGNLKKASILIGRATKFSKTLNASEIQEVIDNPSITAQLKPETKDFIDQHFLKKSSYYNNFTHLQQQQLYNNNKNNNNNNYDDNNELD